VLRELVRYATLAANGHNTQPWRFELAADSVTLRPDATRRTPAVDPDDHHLWVSLGCATENLLQAAPALGRQGEATVTADGVRIALRPRAAARTSLFDAIIRRQSTRGLYDGKSLRPKELELLDSAAEVPGVTLIWITSPDRLEGLGRFVTRGVQAQMADVAFVSELEQWIRFSEADALGTRDGLFSRASGNPTLPRWLGSRLFPLFFTVDTETKKYTEQLRSSAGAIAFVGAGESKAHWVDVGRAYQRFALQAAALDIRNSFLNQPVEVPQLRREFAQWLGLGSARPDLVVRFGRGRPLTSSLRRPVDAVVE
jgi:hypothetical protein